MAGTVNTLTMGNATLTFANANDTLVITAGGINGGNPNNPNVGSAANNGARRLMKTSSLNQSTPDFGLRFRQVISIRS